MAELTLNQEYQRQQAEMNQELQRQRMLDEEEAAMNKWALDYGNSQLGTGEFTNEDKQARAGRAYANSINPETGVLDRAMYDKAIASDVAAGYTTPEYGQGLLGLGNYGKSQSPGYGSGAGTHDKRTAADDAAFVNSQIKPDFFDPNNTMGAIKNFLGGQDDQEVARGSYANMKARLKDSGASTDVLDTIFSIASGDKEEPDSQLFSSFVDELANLSQAKNIPVEQALSTLQQAYKNPNTGLFDLSQTGSFGRGNNQQQAKPYSSQGNEDMIGSLQQTFGNNSVPNRFNVR